MPTITRSLLVAGIIGFASLSPIALVASLARADDSAIALEGRGKRRADLNALQYTPFDHALWSKLAGPMSGALPSAESLKDRPLVIAAWASWFRGSHPALAQLAELKAKYGAMNLEVIAVHHMRGFDRAEALLKTEDAAGAVRVAHDVKGEFFSALRVDGAGPSYYLIDRAGRLRFAAVDPKSVSDAAAKLVKETPAEAAAQVAPASSDKPAAPDSPAGAADRPAGAAGKLLGPSAVAQLPASAYEGLTWPEHNKRQLSAKNLQGKALPIAFGKETWLDAGGDKTTAPDLGGKIILIDFWATWCGPCRAASPRLDQLQKDFPDDLVVIGISDESAATIQKFLATPKNRHSYPQAVDEKATIKDALEVKGIPHALIISTDGVIRFQGNPHPQADASRIREVVDALVKSDPGVKARKAAATPAP
jgi:cytochrome c biogenesis protein CcmG, thiol:disulfide interchange protein DsbE